MDFVDISKYKYELLGIDEMVVCCGGDTRTLCNRKTIRNPELIAELTKLAEQYSDFNKYGYGHFPIHVIKESKLQEIEKNHVKSTRKFDEQIIENMVKKITEPLKEIAIEKHWSDDLFIELVDQFKDILMSYKKK